MLCGLSFICILLLGRNHYFLIAMKSGCANYLQEVATLESVSSYSWESLSKEPSTIEYLKDQGSRGEVLYVSQIFLFLQIPESLNSAILCKFYFTKFYLLPKIVIRDKPGIQISKESQSQASLLLSSNREAWLWLTTSWSLVAHHQI